MNNVILQSIDGKKIGKIQGRIRGEGWLPIQQYNKSSNVRILACMVVEKSLTKYFIPQSMKGKKIEQIEGRISRRRLVLNPTIQ